MKQTITKLNGILFLAAMFSLLCSQSSFGQTAKSPTLVFEDIVSVYGTICQFNSEPTVDQVLVSCKKYTPIDGPDKNNMNTVLFRFIATFPEYNMHMVIDAGKCPSAKVDEFNWMIQDESTSSIIRSGNISNRKVNGLIVGHSYLVNYTWESACNDNSIYPYIVSNSKSTDEMMSFSVEQGANDIAFSWSTTGESKIDYFELQKSIDNKTFVKLKNIDKALEKNGLCIYSFSDNHSEPGTAFYRLKQFKKDKKVSYSKTAAVNFVKKDNQVKVIPSVVKNEMYVKYYAQKKDLVIMRITDVNGLVVFSQPITATFEGLNLYDFNPKDIKPGTYSASLICSDRTVVTRFTKE